MNKEWDGREVAGRGKYKNEENYFEVKKTKRAKKKRKSEKCDKNSGRCEN